MAYQPRARKRIRALCRGPDGSAFRRCESCGLSVPIALIDMHVCEIEKNARKKAKSSCVSEKVEEQRFEDQPRSAFRFFMEELMKTCKGESRFEIEKKGFVDWKTMSKEERLPFCLKADKVNSAYERLLQKEEDEIQLVDDGADSAEVGKYDEDYVNHEFYSDSEGSDELQFSHSGTHWSFCSEDSFVGFEHCFDRT
ncbi:HMG-box (high mobility group) DNA-binding family protein [Striga hermonthica]|uniref:HMG-box (High mobility group) DNA-binding family protein n=1 Tax=Striga hermonthica TaxID=68872 RepID=A0A9N7NS60_STRHE|nr:HMG-box (high mobility group) DNA-binding family protein [Striga hermonthica]